MRWEKGRGGGGGGGRRMGEEEERMFFGSEVQILGLRWVIVTVIFSDGVG